MAMQIFVVSERAFNTDGDYAEHEGGSYARKAYRSCEAAEREQKRLTIDSYQSENPFTYGDEPLYHMSLDDLNEILGDGNHVESKSDVNGMWDDLSPDTREAIWQAMGWGDDFFYSVREIPVEDCQVREPATV